MPLVWAVAGRQRVLDSSLTQSDQTLLLLYNEMETAVPIEDLADWVEAPRLSDYSRVVSRLHAKRLVEFDSDTRTVVLSPTGAAKADEILRRLGKA
jgi:hypothetical protein